MGGGGGGYYGGPTSSRDQIREHVRQILKYADYAIRDLDFLEASDVVLFDGAFVRQSYRAIRQETWELGNPINRILKSRQQRKATANEQGKSDTTGD